MKKALTHLLIMGLLLSQIVQTAAQTALSGDDRKLYNQAMSLARKGNLRTATGILQALQRTNPQNPDVAASLATCYVDHQGAPDSALQYVDRALALGQYPRGSRKWQQLLFTKAQALQLDSRPAAALPIYDELAAADTIGALAFRLAALRETCDNAIKLMAAPVECNIRSVGDKIRSTYDDYQPVLSVSEDTLLYMSRRPHPGAKKALDGQYPEWAYRSVRAGNRWDGAEWGKPQRYTDVRYLRDTTVVVRCPRVTCIAEEGRAMYMDLDGDIYSAERDTSGFWRRAMRVEGSVNTDFREGGAYVTSDGQMMFFWSNCPGGYGGRDIYLSRLLPNGKWSMRRNLGPQINTAGDEEGAYYDEERRTLYFASTGHNSIGGYDIFYSLANDSDRFVKAQNVGYPINTPADETMFRPSADRTRALLVSSRRVNNETLPSLNIYELDYELKDIDVMAVVTLDVEAKDLTAVEVEVREGTTLIGVNKPNPETGRMVLIIDARKVYHLTAKYHGHTEVRTVQLKGSDSFGVRNKVVEVEPLIFDAEARDPQRFTIQLLSVPSKAKEGKIQGLPSEQVSEHRSKGGLYIYSYGAFADEDAAQTECDRVRLTTKYKEAYVRLRQQIVDWAAK